MTCWGEHSPTAGLRSLSANPQLLGGFSLKRPLTPLLWSAHSPIISLPLEGSLRGFTPAPRSPCFNLHATNSVFQNSKHIRNRAYHLYCSLKNNFSPFASDLALRVQTDLGREILDFYICSYSSSLPGFYAINLVLFVHFWREQLHGAKKNGKSWNMKMRLCIHMCIEE